uniref:Uncharacterized protein n=1 Tax=Arundo donax TaxID=35708 RepID=A0A0A9CCZ3_ARUDO
MQVAIAAAGLPPPKPCKFADARRPLPHVRSAAGPPARRACSAASCRRASARPPVLGRTRGCSVAEACRRACTWAS